MPFLGVFFEFFKSKMGVALLAIMGVGLAIWAGMSAVRGWIDDTRDAIRREVTAEITVDLQQQEAQATENLLREIRENQVRQEEINERLNNNINARNRTIDRISATVQQTIIDQGGEQPASPAVRQSVQLMAEEWDRLYADRIENTDETVS